MLNNYKDYHGYSVYPNGDIINPKTFRKVSTKLLNGYLSTTLYYNSDLHRVYVKNIVAELFLDNYDPDMIVYCKDGNPDNCSISNLGIRKPCNKSVPVIALYSDGTTDTFSSIKSASISTGINQGTLSRLIKYGKKDKEGRLWTKLTT